MQTPVAVDKEPESYDVALEHLDRAGHATDWYFTSLYNVDTGEAYQAEAGEDGRSVVTGGRPTRR